MATKRKYPTNTDSVKWWKRQIKKCDDKSHIETMLSMISLLQQVKEREWEMDRMVDKLREWENKSDESRDLSGTIEAISHEMMSVNM